MLHSKELLSGAIKGDIHSVKVLGEGAFGIVDLVVVDTPNGNLLCVRKKLLKQNDMNNQDPGQEVSQGQHEGLSQEGPAAADAVKHLGATACS